MCPRSRFSEPTWVQNFIVFSVKDMNLIVLIAHFWLILVRKVHFFQCYAKRPKYVHTIDLNFKHGLIYICVFLLFCVLKYTDLPKINTLKCLKTEYPWINRLFLVNKSTDFCNCAVFVCTIKKTNVKIEINLCWKLRSH